MTNLSAWLNQRTQEDQHLYEQYGKPLEKAHAGEYAAIGADGQTIVGPIAAEVLRQAIDTFGSGKFAFRRVGYRTFGRWLTVGA
jgi:hypothetical protein